MIPNKLVEAQEDEIFMESDEESLTIEHELPSWPSVFVQLGSIHEGRESGLKAMQDIPTHTVLMQIPAARTMYAQNLPNFLKECQDISDDDRTILYLMSLFESIEKVKDKRVAAWAAKSTFGFTSFNEGLINKSNDKELDKKYYSFSKKLYKSSRQIFDLQSVQKIFPLLGFVEMELVDFHELYDRAVEFKSTRVFGYTKDEMLIPYFDYINYNPCIQTNVSLFSYDTREELQSKLGNLKTSHRAQDPTLGQILEKVEEAEQCVQKMGQAVQRVEQKMAAMENIEQNMGQNMEQNERKQENMEQDEKKEEKVEDKHGAAVETKKYLGLVATRPISNGQQLLLDYGKLGNTKLFMNYGYAVKDNPYSTLVLFISKQVSDNMIFYHKVPYSWKVILSFDCLNTKLIKGWARYHGKTIKQSLPGLIEQLGERAPPEMGRRDLTFYRKNYSDQTLYLEIYQEDNYRIYESQIRQLEWHLDVLNRGTDKVQLPR